MNNTNYNSLPTVELLIARDKMVAKARRQGRDPKQVNEICQIDAILRYRRAQDGTLTLTEAQAERRRKAAVDRLLQASGLDKYL